MRLTVLGNNGPYPAANGACSGYLLESDSGETRILIDCGTGVLAKLMALDVFDSLNAIVLSHLHFDHISDIFPMRYALQFRPRKAALPVYAPSHPAEIRSMLNDSRMDIWPVQDVTVGEMKISFCPVRHPVETFAVAVECDGKRFVYTGDTNTDFGLELFCDHADFLLADAGLSSEDYAEDKPHLSAALCGKLAKDTACGRLLLTHLNPKYEPSELLKEAVDAFEKAEIAELDHTYYI